MRIIKPLAVLSLLTALAACGAQHNGYYAADGTYVKPHEGAFSNNINERRANYDQTVIAEQQKAAASRYAFERRGYYDYYGNFIVLDTSMGVPPAMFPPAGMCRVWFPDRPLQTQPAVESCANISGRAPSGTYVIYGG